MKITNLQLKYLNKFSYMSKYNLLMESAVTKSVPKKRGRTPKAKVVESKTGNVEKESVETKGANTKTGEAEVTTEVVPKPVPKKRGRKPKNATTGGEKKKSKRKPKKTYSVNQGKVTSFFENKPKQDEVIILHLENDADEIKGEMGITAQSSGVRVRLEDPSPYHMPLSVMPGKDQRTGYVPSSTREPDFNGGDRYEDSRESEGNEDSENDNKSDKSEVDLFSTMDLYTQMLQQREIDNNVMKEENPNTRIDFKNGEQDTTRLSDLGDSSYEPFAHERFIQINENERSKAGLPDEERESTTLQGIKSYRSLKVADEDIDPFDLRLTVDGQDDQNGLGEYSVSHTNPNVDIVYDVNKKRNGLYIKDSLNYRVKSTSLRPTIQRTVIHPTLHNILNCNDNSEWPYQTNIHCWWCCYQFDGPPVALPKKYNSRTKQFSVIGNFCSFNCSEAYRVDNRKEYLTAGMLCMMYNILNDGEIREINPSPPRTALDIFGGPLTIEEFRNASLTLHRYAVVDPPLIAIVHQIEESWAEPMPKSHTGGKSIFKNVGGSAGAGSGFRSSRGKDKSHLRLKRSKPLPNSRNTLDSLLKITKVKKASIT